MPAGYGDNYGQENYGYISYGQDNRAHDDYGQENYGSCGQDNYGNTSCGQENYGQGSYGYGSYGSADTGRDNTGYDNAGRDNAGYEHDKKLGGKKKQGDFGPQPFVVNINSAARHNKFYRTTLWTGPYLQLTLMSISDEIGLEVHPDTDQFIRIEEGFGLVMMGDSPDNLTFRMNVGKNSAIFVPAGTWHNLVNCGPVPIKLYTIYAPPHHKPGTIHPTRKDAMEAEH